MRRLLSAIRRVFFVFLAFFGAYGTAAAEIQPQLVESSQDNAGITAFQTLSTQTTVTMRPSDMRPSQGPSIQRLRFVFACVNQFTGFIEPNVDIRIDRFEVIANTGGHDHHDVSRPKGTFEPVSGNTGPSGLWSTVYTAPELAGITDVDLVCVTSTGPTAPLSFTIGVRIDGLEQLSAGDNYTLIGSFGEPGVTSKHVQNHYGTSTLVKRIIGLANDYAKKFTDQKLAINDMSLVEGGLFDIGNNWQAPHASHRLGTDVDIALVPTKKRRRALRRLIRNGENTFSTIIDEGNHWHLRL